MSARREITPHDRQGDAGRRRGLHARPRGVSGGRIGFDLAVRVATVTRLRIAVVTFFGREHDAITATRKALKGHRRLASRRQIRVHGAAQRLVRTRRRAAVEGHQVVVVALLGTAHRARRVRRAIHDTVTTIGRGRLRMRRLARVAHEAGVQLAGRGAARNGALFVALFVTDDEAVTAHGDALRAGERTFPTGDDLTSGGAAVLAVVRAVITLLGAGHFAVAALHRHAQAAVRRTNGSGFDRAGGAAAVQVIDDAVVTLLGAGENAVTTAGRDASRLRCRALPASFQLAGA